MYAQVREKGMTIVPTKLYFKDGRVKAELALGKGKDLRDKRRDVSERDAKRDIDRALKSARS
jgi:SsrA-binding protein